MNEGLEQESWQQENWQNFMKLIQRRNRDSYSYSGPPLTYEEVLNELNRFGHNPNSSYLIKIGSYFYCFDSLIKDLPQDISRLESILEEIIDKEQKKPIKQRFALCFNNVKDARKQLREWLHYRDDTSLSFRSLSSVEERVPYQFDFKATFEYESVHHEGGMFFDNQTDVDWDYSVHHNGPGVWRREEPHTETISYLKSVRIILKRVNPKKELAMIHEHDETWRRIKEDAEKMQRYWKTGEYG